MVLGYIIYFPTFPSLLEVLPDHLNAEIVAGTVTSKQDAMDYLMWTYFFRRLLRNPSYYQLEGEGSAAINQYLSELVSKSLGELQESYCIDIEEVTNRWWVEFGMGVGWSEGRER